MEMNAGLIFLFQTFHDVGGGRTAEPIPFLNREKLHRGSVALAWEPLAWKVDWKGRLVVIRRFAPVPSM